MKKFLFTTLLAAICTLSATAQDGMTYYLPKTAVQISLLIEKTTFTPGNLAAYSDIYFKSPAESKPSVSYRVVGVNFWTTAIPDTAKRYEIFVDKKHSILSIDCDKNGVLLAINAKGKRPEAPQPFKPARKVAPLNPQDYMSQDILSSGNYPTMARLVAQEIYDIRESRNMLSRGEADFMPQDGEQLKIMLNQLSTQEKALIQVFQGTTVRDTTEQVVAFVPEKDVKKQLAFRFSRHYGLTDIDDLGAAPYYAEVEDENIVAEMPDTPEEKKQKDDLSIGVNLPGKINIKLTADGHALASYSTYAAQFGRVEKLSGTLFGKKLTSHVTFNPVTGNVEHIETEPLE